MHQYLESSDVILHNLKHILMWIPLNLSQIFSTLFFLFTGPTAAGSCRVRAQRSLRGPPNVSQTLTPPHQHLIKAQTKTAAVSVPPANLHAAQELYVGGTGTHPGLWTVCWPRVKQHILAAEHRRRENLLSETETKQGNGFCLEPRSRRKL